MLPAPSVREPFHSAWALRVGMGSSQGRGRDGDRTVPRVRGSLPLRRPPLPLPARHAALDDVPGRGGAVALEEARAHGRALARGAEHGDRALGVERVWYVVEI